MPLEPAWLRWINGIITIHTSMDLVNVRQTNALN
jgi:hypothetical protein